MKKVLFSILFIFSSLISFAEDMNETKMEEVKSTPEQFIQIKGDNLKHVCNPEYSMICSKIVSYCPSIKNISQKTIVGIKYDIDFIDSFGDVVVSKTDLKSNEKVLKNGSTKCDYFYYFNNGSNEYSKLSEPIDNKTIKTKIKIKTIVFQDGTVESF